MLAPQIAARLKELGSARGNVTEFAKNPDCWARITKSRFEIPPETDRATIDIFDAKARLRTARADGAIDQEIEFQKLIVENLHRLSEMELNAKRRSMLSPNTSKAFRKLTRGNINLGPSEWNALKHLAGRLDQMGMGPSDWPSETA